MLRLAKSFAKRLIIDWRLYRERARRRAGAPEFVGLTPDLWGYAVDREGYLAVHGVRATELVARFGSPLHVVSPPWLRKTLDDFIGPFSARYPRVRLATSYKTNPVPGVLRLLHDCGTYAEVISEFEFWLAERLGLPGERIIVNGPGKNRSLLTRAVRAGAKVINIDSPGEIDVIAAEAERVGRRQAVGVRVVTSVGWSSQFGLSIQAGDALAAFERIKGFPSLTPTAVHLHIGTGLKKVSTYERAIRELLEFTAVLRARLGIELALYDLGGGFGVPTVRAGDVWDDRMIALGYTVPDAFPPDCPTAAEYAEMVARSFAGFAASGSFPEIVLEPGRAITSSAQTLLLSVLAVKSSGGIRRLIMDGGKNITLPLAWETHKIFPGRAVTSPFDTKCDLYGPLCHPGDILSQNLLLPRLEVGDVIAIMDAGAYFIPNQMNFSNPRPQIIAVDSSGVRVLRRPESFEDIVQLDDMGHAGRPGS